MKTTKTTRKDFIRLASAGLGGLSIIQTFAETQRKMVAKWSGAGGKKANIVVIGAHPGDPEFGCGGTMSQFSKAGHQVTFLYLTRGEAGDPSKSFAESAALRTREAEVSCDILGVKALFAGQIDGNTVYAKNEFEEMLALLSPIEPDLVFSHWPMDSHPDHQVAGMLTLSYWIRTAKRFQLYFYEVNTGSETMYFEPTDYVDVSNVLDIKKRAMFAHKTQSPEEVYNTFFKKMEDFRGLEAGVPSAEAFIHFTDKSKPILLKPGSFSG